MFPSIRSCWDCSFICILLRWNRSRITLFFPTVLLVCVGVRYTSYRFCSEISLHGCICISFIVCSRLRLWICLYVQGFVYWFHCAFLLYFPIFLFSFAFHFSFTF